MGRRSDHTRGELRALFVEHGHAHLGEVGLARFSGREVAKRAGYSVGTIANLFGSVDGLIAAINSRSFERWAELLDEQLSQARDDRIAALVAGYFAFAEQHPELWSAIYAHRLPEGIELPEDDRDRRAGLTRIVEEEVRTALPADTQADVVRLSRSLVAVVHGHCSFVVSGSFALLEEPDPKAAALARVRESLGAHGYRAEGQ
ncbi:TetR/AcrR family transcriptional regulator [Croceicoccus naphthovorans]|uniref:TetR family transcriptional regulator n=1 Tax=Croceicoccus naphthovorans TaxID=1348774 RepID=A0A0G3XFR4_9SPHN|nr:TetR/AcrR family transcriptional regulator [Croceicoccus naphthovorans]AKM09203.1 TetR family transcriptional regulator [Croceicoccus naphthovorans]MBB3990414.1 AcrR family transcriptional regulator [Croceicoccus naphthovorans]